MTNASAVLAALGDPTRRAIFERLTTHPGAVGDLAREFPVTRSAVSQHLKILKLAGIVTDQAVGTRRIYTVDPEALATIREYFDSFWKQSMAAFRTAAQRRTQEET